MLHTATGVSITDACLALVAGRAGYATPLEALTRTIVRAMLVFLALIVTGTATIGVVRTTSTGPTEAGRVGVAGTTG